MTQLTFAKLMLPPIFIYAGIVLWQVFGHAPGWTAWLVWLFAGYFWTIACCIFVIDWRRRRSRGCALCQVLVYRSPGAHLRHLARAHRGQELQYLGAWADAIEARTVADWTEDLL